MPIGQCQVKNLYPARRAFDGDPAPSQFVERLSIALDRRYHGWYLCDGPAKVGEGRLDLVSYSAWDGQDDPKTLRAALDFIASKMPDSRPFGDKNVYVGEFGKPENEFGQKKVRATVQGVVEVAVDWGCPYVVYWQLYCNEPRRRPVSSNADVRGFWLIRPDGSRSGTWHFLRGLFERGG